MAASSEVVQNATHHSSPEEQALRGPSWAHSGTAQRQHRSSAHGLCGQGITVLDPLLTPGAVPNQALAALAGVWARLYSSSAAELFSATLHLCSLLCLMSCSQVPAGEEVRAGNGVLILCPDPCRTLSPGDCLPWHSHSSFSAL